MCPSFHAGIKPVSVSMQLGASLRHTRRSGLTDFSQSMWLWTLNHQDQVFGGSSTDDTDLRQFLKAVAKCKSRVCCDEN